MRCAIIAPHDMLDLCSLVDDYHMVLPQETFRNPNYVRFYRDCKGYKILDNGAAEGEIIDPVDLAAIAESVKADEIVVPDVIGDRQGTIDRVRDFERFVNPEMNYMGVAQGDNLSDIISMIWFYEGIDWITTIGLPRWLLNWDITQRATILNAMHTHYPEFYNSRQWHCLGANPAFPLEVAVLSTVEGVRGIDTSLPVVYGLRGAAMTSPGKYKRSEDFFDQKIERTSATWEQIYDNVVDYLRLAGVTLLGEETPAGGV